jgi:hypothetical protein
MRHDGLGHALDTRCRQRQWHEPRTKPDRWLGRQGIGILDAVLQGQGQIAGDFQRLSSMWRGYVFGPFTDDCRCFFHALSHQRTRNVLPAGEPYLRLIQTRDDVPEVLVERLVGIGAGQPV